jgi:outer membrane protein OmpA-like peptidoglycan-associated protein
MAWSWRYGWIFKTNPMKKVMICLTGCLLLALITPRAQEISRQAPESNRPVADTTRQMPDTATIVKDSSAIPPAVTTPPADTTVKANGNDSVISLVDDAPAAPVAPVKKHKRSAKHDSPAAPVAAATPVATATPVAAITPDTTTTAVATTTPVATATPDATNTNPVPQNDTATKTNVVVTADQAASQTAVAPTTVAAATKPDTTAKTQDSTSQDGTPPTHELDRRWFISPLLKLQFQDFAMLEKNREGYLSNANTLPFFQRGNASFAASAYKNITSRLSFSADLGLSFGHVTNNNVEISQTKSQTFNLLNAAVYYHLLPASYRLQPYITIGINDIINNASYVSIPMGIGAKFNARRIMVLAEVNYGYAANKNISNTTMYSMGIYIPIKSKKQKQLDKDDNSPDKRSNKDDAKKKDSTNKNNGTIINNIYVTINMDSVLKAKGLIGDDGTPGSAGRRNGNGGDDGDDDGSGGGSGSHGKKRRGLRNFDVDDFQKDDFKMDSLDGRPVIRFVVYFEFNEYGLTDRAFANIDRVIGHLRKTPNQFTVEIKGYTDSVGTDPFNNWLSRKRAKMVLDYMNSRGIPAELMQAKAYGRDNPVGNNSDPNTAWLNRRAEVIVHAKEALANDK